MKQFHTKSIHIVGYGHEGSTTTHFLLNQGVDPKHITIHDQNTDKNLPDGTIAKLGEQFGEGIQDADIIFRTAGIPLHHTVFTGIDSGKITSQAQLFFDHFKGKTIGITGSKGKSTTTAMIHTLLTHAGKQTILVGNIGAGWLTDIPRDNTEVIAVCELSSGQLEGLDMHLDIGIFTNFYPIHHVGRHGSLEKYRQAKLTLVTHSDTLILNTQIVQDNPEIMHAVGTTPYVEYGSLGDYFFEAGSFQNRSGETLGTDTSMKLLGDHNRRNACTLFAIADQLGIGHSHVQHVIETFTGLPHRLENIGVVNGITWINDAIATTPQATLAAISTLGNKLGTIFLGGKDEGYDYQELCTVLNAHPTLSTIILFPDTHQVYLDQLDSEKFKIHVCHSMHEAVILANTHTPAGKVALLSCASPSMSLWSSYREKGEQFREEVKKLITNR